MIKYERYKQLRTLLSVVGGGIFTSLAATVLWELRNQLPTSRLAWCLVAAIGLGGALIVWRMLRPSAGEALAHLDRWWRQKAQETPLAAASLMRVTDFEKGSCLDIPPEFLLNRNSGRWIVALLDSPLERREIERRIGQGYLALKDVESFGPRNAITPVIVGSSETPIGEELLAEALAEIVGQTKDVDFGRQVVRQLVSGLADLAPLVDKTSLHAHEFNSWLERQAQKKAPGSALIFASHRLLGNWRPDAAGMPSVVVAEVVRETNVGDVPGELSNRADTLVLTLARNESRAGGKMRIWIDLRSLAAAFLGLRLATPARRRFYWREIEPRAPAAGDLLERLSDVIEMWDEAGVQTFEWKSSESALRDYLVARALAQGEHLDEAFLRAVNDSPECPYVRACIEWPSSSRENPLGRFPLQSQHKLIEAAWFPDRYDDSEIFVELDKIKGLTSELQLIPSDAIRLVPVIVRSRLTAEFKPWFLAIGPYRSAECILATEAPAEAIAAAVAAVLSDQTIWQYFEDGGVLPDRAVQILRDPKTARQFRKLLLLLACAPHGQPLTEEMRSFLRDSPPPNPAEWEFMKSIFGTSDPDFRDRFRDLISLFPSCFASNGDDNAASSLPNALC